MNTDPLAKSKADYSHIVDLISVTDSPVGIDAQFTHAIIITYLQQILERLDRIESQIGSPQSPS